MKVQILSDLHLEFFKYGKIDFIESLIPEESVDVLVLAGDISTKFSLKEDLKVFCDNWKNVVFISGNHEYYNSGFKEIGDILSGLEASNLNVLNDSFVEIEGQRFIGSTLWFPDGPYNAIQSKHLNDFSKIKDFSNEIYARNFTAREFLSKEVRSEDIVISHHFPLERSVADQYRNSLFNCFFLCDMSELISNKNPKLWIHGHTHGSFDYNEGETRVICNPFGYCNPHNASENENKDFTKHLIINLEGI